MNIENIAREIVESEGVLILLDEQDIFEYLEEGEIEITDEIVTEIKNTDFNKIYTHLETDICLGFLDVDYN